MGKRGASREEATAVDTVRRPGGSEASKFAGVERKEEMSRRVRVPGTIEKRAAKRTEVGARRGTKVGASVVVVVVLTSLWDR